MSGLTRMLARAALLGAACAGVLLMPASAADGSSAVPMFSPLPNNGWVPDRPTGDDFIPVPGFASPVMSDPKHPYVPNGGGRQPTYRVADLSNPILKPWAVEQMRKANEQVLQGAIPYVPRERCWPAGVPAYVLEPPFNITIFIETPKEIVIVH